MLKSLDIFPKVSPDLLSTTKTGGFLSLLTYSLLSVLILNELLSYSQIFSPQALTETVVVDTSLGKRLRINLNVTFFELDCSEVHLDAMDVAGDNQIGVGELEKKGSIKKNPNPDKDKSKLKLDEVFMGLGLGFTKTRVKFPKNRNKKNIYRMDAIPDGKIEEIANDHVEAIPLEDLPEDYCGDCYGATFNEEEKTIDEETGEERVTSPSTECCNTCDEVIAAYSKKGWSTAGVMSDSEQCNREKRNPLHAIKRGEEGCNLAGSMLVNKVGGNFHVAMGEAMVRDGRHIHQFKPQDAPGFNSSHVVHSLSFGNTYPGMGESALDGIVMVATEEEHGGTGLYQYFLKIVPTTYQKKGGIMIETNRYGVTTKFKPLMTVIDVDMDEGGFHSADTLHHAHKEVDNVDDVKAKDDTKKEKEHRLQKIQNSVLPGVFFVYEIHPFAIEVTDAESSVPFSHLIMRLISVVGGVLTVGGYVDKVLHLLKTKGGGGGDMNMINLRA